MCDWKEFKSEIKRNRENSLIELYLYEITTGTEDNRKRRKMAIRKVLQAQYR